MKRIPFIAISGVLLLSATAAFAAYDFTGPTQGPTGGNTPGVIWNMQSGTQTGAKIDIDGSARIGDNFYMNSGKAIRVDSLTGATTLNMGNWGNGLQPFTLNVYGDTYLKQFSGGGALGKNGAFTADGPITSYNRIDSPQYCINGANCITAWPSGGGGTLTGITAGTGITVTGSSPSPTVNFDTTYGDNRYVNVTGDSMIGSTGTMLYVENDQSSGFPKAINGASTYGAGLYGWSYSGYGIYGYSNGGTAGYFGTYSGEGIYVENAGTGGLAGDFYNRDTTTNSRVFLASTNGNAIQALRWDGTYPTDFFSLNRNGTLSVTGTASVKNPSPTGSYGLYAQAAKYGVYGLGTDSTSGIGGGFNGKAKGVEATCNNAPCIGLDAQAGSPGFGTAIRGTNGAVGAELSGSIYSLTATGTALFYNDISSKGNINTVGYQDFGSQTRQMINLYGGGPNAGYGIGVQNSTLYNRSSSQYAWYRGGTHSNTQQDPGTGGKRLMWLDTDGQLHLPSQCSGGLCLGTGGRWPGYYFQNRSDYNQEWSLFSDNMGGSAGNLNAAGIYLGSTKKMALDLNGDLWIAGSNAYKGVAGSWVVPSDIRLKNRISPYDRGLDEILKLQPIRFHYKPGNEKGLDSTKEGIGFSAQDVQKVIPEAVTTDAQGYLNFTADPVIWASVNAIKELKTENDKLKAQNASLEWRLKVLEAKVDALLEK